MPHTIFAVYSRMPDTAELRAELVAAGVSADDIRISTGVETAGADMLSGVPADDMTFYRESLERGRTVVRVRAGDANAEKVSQLLDRYGPITQREGVH